MGRLTRWVDFRSEVEDFQSAPPNHRFLRRRLRLRVSVERMRVLFSEVMGRPISAGSLQSPPPDTSRDDWGSLVAD